MLNLIYYTKIKNMKIIIYFFKEEKEWTDLFYLVLSIL